MDSLDLHPEELFDKAQRGEASPGDLARLDAHLGSCATCRFERMVRADFDAVSALPVDVDDLVARALSGAAQAAPVEGPGRRRRLAPLLVAAVAMVGFASFAAVAQFTGVLPRLITQLSGTPAPQPAPAPMPQRSAPPKVEAPTQVLDEALPDEALPPEPVVAVAPRPAVRVVPSPARDVVVEPTPEIPPAPVVAPEPDALTLFSRAQRARVQGDTGAAIRDFRLVVARFPGAPEASLSHAEIGRLLLDRGEAASALESFDAYLGSGDQVLREDVQGARAMSLQVLKRPDDERSAWEAVLRDYPNGVYAPRARNRLESLTP